MADPYYQNQGYSSSAPMMNNPQYEQPYYPQNEQPMVKEESVGISYEYSVRRGFIVKTYGILLSQLAITCFFISLTFIKPIRKFVSTNFLEHPNPVITIFSVIFLIVTITVCIVFGCCRDTARRVPINYILLFSFTLCMSFYCFLLCSIFEPEEVISAALLTFGATVGLTIYAYRTTTDYTYCGGFLFALLLIMIFSVFLFFWIEFTVVYLIIGVLIYSLYLIYDTQLILGSFGVRYNIDDYCLAALNLYIDIIYIFIKLLQILGAAKRR